MESNLVNDSKIDFIFKFKRLHVRTLYQYFCLSAFTFVLWPGQIYVIYGGDWQGQH